MRKNYQQPEMRVVTMQQTQMLCHSYGENVIGPGEPNSPAGAPQLIPTDWGE